MFRTFFGFELNYWLRGMMLYVFIAIVATLTFFATYGDNVQIGGTGENTLRNAPHVIQTYFGVLSILCSVMVTAFVNSAASRDFACNTHQIIFTKPVSKMSYLWGRFWGSTLVAAVPLTGISIGIIFAGLMASVLPGNDPEQWGPVVWQAHIWGMLIFAIPNAILIGAIIFAIAIWTRSSIASFLGVLMIIIAYSVSGILLQDLDNLSIAQLFDPFGSRAFGIETRYWTVDEKNTQYLMLSGMMLWNRLLWMGAAAVIFAAACLRFRFTERNKASWFARRPKAATKTADTAAAAASSTAVAIPTVQFRSGTGTELRQLRSQISIDFFSTLKSSVFVVVILFALINCLASLMMSRGEGFGNASLPVTYKMIDIVRGSMYIFLVSMIAFYSGVLIWKEREAHLDEVYDALPHPTWLVYTGKLISLVLLIGLTIAFGMLMSVLVQAGQGYHRYQLGLYGKEFTLDMVMMTCLCVLSLFCHVISPNKYFGYFLFVILLIANAFASFLLSIESNMINFAELPGYTYSDLFGHAPFAAGLIWFSAYWLAAALLISIACILLWRRGRETGAVSRMKAGMSRWTGGLKLASCGALVAWAAITGWVFYNTQHLNAYVNSEVLNDRRADFEKRFKDEHENTAQPRITKVNYTIDIFPEKRGLVMKGQQTLENRSEAPIETIYIAVADGFETSVTIEKATLQEDFEDYLYQVYKVDPPLAAGDTIQMEYTVSYEPKGFENSISKLQLVQNGTFFNNSICPQIGYPRERELSNKNDRKKRGLSEPELMPELQPENLAARANTYISNSSDWVDVETIISTSPDQIAVAPGSLIREWEADGRRYFHYRVDHPSLNFYSFISADYKVARDKWNDVDIEVYYHADHEWNVPNMLQSINDSLQYYSQAFGPYKHKQARIIEFPRISSFAQAFPGTMPYSEGIGFIADISDEDDIDMVYYVVAHEMAHQWWAHQVVGANMKGATLLSETLAQYSALMLMEKEYGRNMMRRFLRHEMDNYLRSRGSEGLKEQPLRTVEASQGYVHYRKGSVVMYHLKEVMGEDKLNEALRSIVDRFAYQGPPYPTSVDLIDAIKANCPPEAYELVDDLFNRITLFANRTEEATYRRLDNGKYEVTIEVDCRKFVADDKGKEIEVEFTSLLEIGAFAAPEPGHKFGETLYRNSVEATTGMNTFTFVVDELPERAGIDPFLLLVDRMPQDNTKRVKEVTGD